MNLGRCPVCHSRISLEAVVQDEAGRALLALLAGLPSDLGAALVSYLGLFRSPTRDLPNDRALRLAREALALEASQPRLAIALGETVEALRAKGGDPLKSHNYLKKVVASTADPVAVCHQPAPTAAPVLKSRTAAALMALQEPGE